MNKVLIAGLLSILVSTAAYAARITELKVQDAEVNKDELKIKLQSKETGPEGYFWLKFKADALDSSEFEKLALLFRIQKSTQACKLQINIASFSVSPPGSAYPSTAAKFNCIK